MQPGDLLPLDRGAGGRILLAYAGAKGAVYSKIRREQCVILVGDRVPELAGIGTPVFDASGAMAGAITLTMPAERLNRDDAQFVPVAARHMTTMLGGSTPCRRSSRNIGSGLCRSGGHGVRARIALAIERAQRLRAGRSRQPRRTRRPGIQSSGPEAQGQVPGLNQYLVVTASFDLG